TPLPPGWARRDVHDGEQLGVVVPVGAEDHGARPGGVLGAAEAGGGHAVLLAPVIAERDGEFGAASDGGQPVGDMPGHDGEPASRPGEPSRAASPKSRSTAASGS